MKYCSVVKKNEIMKFEAIWVKLGKIELVAATQTQNDKKSSISLTWVPKDEVNNDNNRHLKVERRSP